MRHATERYTDDDPPTIELVTLKVTQLDEENWRWELLGKRYLSKGRTEPVTEGRCDGEQAELAHGCGPGRSVAIRLTKPRQRFFGFPSLPRRAAPLSKLFLESL
jgi:hypothetical protein